MKPTAPALSPPQSIHAPCGPCWKSALISPLSAPNRPKNSRIQYSTWQSQSATGPNRPARYAAQSSKLPSKNPRAREVIHKSFADPAAASGSEEEQLEVFRQVRDEIKDWITKTFGG